MNIDIEYKKNLRKSMKALRASQRGDDQTLVKNFFSLPELQDKSTFFVYNAFGSEADTMPVIHRLLQEDKKIFLPRVENTDMVAGPYEKDAPMPKSNYGIAEPTGAAYFGDIEVTVLPLLATDTKGNRLGYGGGYYDKFLQDKNTLKIGYCYDFQVLDELHAQPHDVKLDIIVTDKRILRIQEVER